MRRPELVRILAGPSASVEEAALVLARDEYPALDVRSYLDTLDQLAAPLRGRLSKSVSPAETAAELANYMGYDLGFRGDTEDYYAPRNSYLNEVIDRRLGIPISLCAIWIALGTRAGAVVQGVGFPGHFLVRVGTDGGVYVDPFNAGRVLNLPHLRELARRTLGNADELRPEHLVPSSAETMIVRMLLNLKHAHEARHDHARALVVCDRLADITGRVIYRRDRGLHALALGSTATAIDDLEAYLAEKPNAGDASSVMTALAKAKALPQPSLQ